MSTEVNWVPVGYGRNGNIRTDKNIVHSDDGKNWNLCTRETSGEGEYGNGVSNRNLINSLSIM